MQTKEYTLENLKDDIIYHAKVNDWFANTPEQKEANKTKARTTLDKLFRELDVSEFILATTQKSQLLKDNFENSTIADCGYEGKCTVLSTKRWDNNARLMVAYPPYEGAESRTTLCAILAISRQLSPRDWEEKTVLTNLSGGICGEHTYTTPNRIGVRYFIGAATLVEDGSDYIIKLIQRVPAAFQAFQDYQRERTKKAQNIAHELYKQLDFYKQERF